MGIGKIIVRSAALAAVFAMSFALCGCSAIGGTKSSTQARASSTIPSDSAEYRDESLLALFSTNHAANIVSAENAKAVSELQPTEMHDTEASDWDAMKVYELPANPDGTSPDNSKQPVSVLKFPNGTEPETVLGYLVASGRTWYQMIYSKRIDGGISDFSATFLFLPNSSTEQEMRDFVSFCESQGARVETMTRDQYVQEANAVNKISTGLMRTAILKTYSSRLAYVPSE